MWMTGSHANQCTTYRLYAVVNHHGEDPNRGHYTAYARVGAGCDSCWYLFDDSCVLPAHETDVVTKDAYILLYERNCDDPTMAHTSDTRTPGGASSSSVVHDAPEGDSNSESRADVESFEQVNDCALTDGPKRNAASSVTPEKAIKRPRTDDVRDNMSSEAAAVTETETSTLLRDNASTDDVRERVNEATPVRDTTSSRRP